MIDFVKELAGSRVEGTQIPFYPEKIKGYSEAELDMIANEYNLEIHGQFKQLLLQMGRCSGGLLWSYEFYLYGKTSPSGVLNSWQQDMKQDAYFMSASGVVDPIDNKLFVLSCENQMDFYYLVTANRDDYVWSYYDNDENSFKNTNLTLLDYLKRNVRYHSKQSVLHGFNMEAPKIYNNMTGFLV